MKSGISVENEWNTVGIEINVKTIGFSHKKIQKLNLTIVSETAKKSLIGGEFGSILGTLTKI